jgi:hypothetical protein
MLDIIKLYYIIVISNIIIEFINFTILLSVIEVNKTELFYVHHYNLS